MKHLNLLFPLFLLIDFAGYSQGTPTFSPSGFDIFRPGITHRQFNTITHQWNAEIKEAGRLNPMFTRLPVRRFCPAIALSLVFNLLNLRILK